MAPSMATLQRKRVYDPSARTDGRRLLVERLWPRGMTKAKVAADAWLKDVAPSARLRVWFGHQAERFVGFRDRYRRELRAHPAAWQDILALAQQGPVTLLYSAHDPDRNGAAVLQEFLLEHLDAVDRPAPAASGDATARRRARRQVPASRPRTARRRAHTSSR